MARSEMIKSVDALVRRERQRWAASRSTIVAVAVCAFVYAILAHGAQQ